MKRYWIIGVIALCLSTTAPAEKSRTLAEAAMPSSWFESTNCSGLDIRRFKQDAGNAPTHVLQIDDAEAVSRLTQRINQMSADGGMMISFVPDERIELVFLCDSREQLIKIYNGQFKTPSTGFNTDAANRGIEKSLYEDLVSLLFPAIGKRILRISDLDVRFSDFALVYKGTTQWPQAPVTVSGSTAHFTVRDKTGHEQALDINAGQLSPQPLQFTVNGMSMSLLTSQSDDGRALYPDYFQIVRCAAKTDAGCSPNLEREANGPTP